MSNERLSLFKDTLQSLADCYEYLDAPGYAEAKDRGLPEILELSPSETIARRDVVAMCKAILEKAGCTVKGEPIFCRRFQ